MDMYMVSSFLIFTNCVLAIPEAPFHHKDVTKDVVNQQPNQPIANFESNKTRINKKIKNNNGLNKFVTKEKDLQVSAAEYGVPNFVPPSALDFYDHHPAKDCHACNDQPWVPIYGRSLAIPQHDKEFNSHDLSHDFDEKTSHFHPFYPSLDEYSAPQSEYDYPRPGDVVEFMLPPPLSLNKPFTSFGDRGRPLSGPSSSGFAGSIYPTDFKKHRKPQYFRYSSLSQDMLPPSYAPSFTSYPQNFGKEYSLSSFNNNFKLSEESLRAAVPQTTVNAEGYPGVGNLPLAYSNFNLHGPIPSDSYGQPLLPNSDTPFHPLPPSLPTLSDTIQLPSVEPSDSYGSPIPQFDSTPSAQQKLPFLRASNNYGQAFEGTELRYRPPHIESVKATLFKTGSTDVQVVPSVKIADYTASVEHPINLIQSPILDLDAKNQNFQQISNNFELVHNSVQHTQSTNSYLDLDVATNNDNIKISKNPIIVKNDDSLASESSAVNTTVPSSTTIKRHNDKYLSTGQTNGGTNVNQNVNWLKNMILENNKETTDKKSIVAIKQMIIDPAKVKANLKIAQPNVDMSTWRSSKENNIEILDHMIPPKPQSSAWVNAQTKSKPLQIIVPYVKHDAFSSEDKNNNKFKFTTLSNIVTPPSTHAELSLWPKYFVDQSVQSNTLVDQTTHVYNIKDFIAENAHKPADLSLPYDVISLQKNIDKWTHQSYSNIKGFGFIKGAEGDNRNKPDLYLKPANHDQKVFSTQKAEIETDQILSSSSDNIEQTLAHNEINDDFDNDVKENNIDNDLFYDKLVKIKEAETTTSKSIPSSSYPTIHLGIKHEKQLWNFVKETKPNTTHEKIYVVTPQSYAFVTSTPSTAYSMAPKIQDGKVNKNPIMTKISVRVERENATRFGDHIINHPVKVVYSEWPHLINNLETTTTTTKSTSRHPLFGLMDIPFYTPPPNSTVETIGGHSKVTMAVTSPSTIRTLISTKENKLNHK